MITIKSPREIDIMARAGHVVAETLALMHEKVRPGISTVELDTLAEKFIRSHPGCRPSFKGLYGFPKTLCTSINEEIVHGIPSPKRVLHEGNILSVDVGVFLDGLHADSATTIPVGTAARAGYGVVRELVGHGIGTQFHEEPQVPNHGQPKRGPRLVEGMTIAIEPMITMGHYATRTLTDRWTVVTTDGSLSAHFEHTVAIGKNGARILTK